MSFTGGVDVIPNPGEIITTVPTGTIIQYPLSTPPTGYLNCDGSLLQIASYQALYNVIGTTYGSNGGTVPVFTWTITSGLLSISFSGGNLNNFISTGDSFKFDNGAGGIYSGLVATVSTQYLLRANISASDSSGSSGTVQRTTTTMFNLPNTKAKTIRGYDNSTYTIAGTGGSDSRTLVVGNIPPHEHVQQQPGGTSLASGSGNRSGDPNTPGPKTYADIYDASGNLVTASGSQPTSFSLVNSYLVLNYCIKYT